MKLSKNLSLAEVTKSNTAIKYGISNQPTGEHLSNLIQIANKIFQPLRDHFNTPIAVSSGYRSKALNDMIGGASGSQHMKGEAFDIVPLWNHHLHVYYWVLFLFEHAQFAHVARYGTCNSCDCICVYVLGHLAYTM